MNKEKYNQIIDNVYENYFLERSALRGPFGVSSLILSKEQFINECKADSKFSDKWGLNIEERELTLEERNQSLRPNETYLSFFGINHKNDLESKKLFDKEGRPTKLITLIYNNETIESYE